MFPNSRFSKQIFGHSAGSAKLDRPHCKQFPIRHPLDSPQIAILWPDKAIFEKRAATVEVDTLIPPVKPKPLKILWAPGFTQPRLSRSKGGHPQRQGTNLGVFVRSGKLQNESSPIFFLFFFVPNFAPEFGSEFSPNFSRNFRASFRGKNPRHFSMQNSQANSKKKSTVFWRAGEVSVCSYSADLTQV